ncbi:hypothetical protein ACQB60_06175 [Actinomycetota bacterium Odt1-20B]
MDDLTGLHSTAGIAVSDESDELLPLLTLTEAQDVVEVLARVAVGERADAVWAGELAPELAARVPSRG